MPDHLNKDGAEKLLRAAKDRMREGRGARLSSIEWDALFQGNDKPPDVAAIVKLVAAAKTLEEARDHIVPPGRLWREALHAIHLLHDTGGGLIVRPDWVARTVDAIAFDQLYAERPTGLGALLLHAETAPRALARVTDDLQEADGVSLVKQALAAADSGTPEALALLDATVRAAGLVAHRLPPDLAGKLWETAMTLAEQRWPRLPPLPIVSVAEVDRWYGPTSLGAWYLAMLALSLRAETTSRPGTALDPWRTAPIGEERARLEEALPHVDSALRGPRGDDERNHDHAAFRPAGVAVGSRLLDTMGVLRRDRQLLDLQTAPILVALAQGATLGLSEAERSEVLELRCGFGVLRQTCEARDVALDEVLGWCWQTWASERNGARPPYAWHRSDDDSIRTDACALWCALPRELLAAPGPPEGGFRDLHAWEVLSGDVALMRLLPSPPWDLWLTRWSKDPLRSTYGAPMFEHLPEDLVERALIEGAVNAFCHDVRRTLWRRMPERLTSLIDRLARVEPHTTYDIPGHGGPILDLVWSAPDDRVAALVKRASEWLAEPSVYLGGGPWVRAWLMGVVAERRPGWREAFAALHATSAYPDSR